jgi:multisubunit Na+/H+ antiporter MnhE subunit
MTPPVKHVVPWLVTWLALFWLWMLLVGEWNHQEWIAAASAATIAATTGEVARRRAAVHARVPLQWIARAWSVPHMIVVDFAIVMWALAVSAVRRDVVRGAFRAHDFPAGGDDAVSQGIRTWVAVAATYSPNAYVVELDPERQLALVHDLVPHRPSESPA